MSGRGFSDAEFKARVHKAQRLMAQHGLEALLLTTSPEVYYFTGFLTRFWESPTRPWYLVVPASGDPIAVIPSIGGDLMGKTWVSDIRMWSSPDLGDDGVSLLIDTLKGFARVGVPMGHESHVRMPQENLQKLQAHVSMQSDHGIVRSLRMVKSPAEIAKIETACSIASRAFARVGEIGGEGVALDQIFRQFQMLCLEEGADWLPYLAGAAGPNGYGDVISPATAAPLRKGDVLMLDTGLVWDGYFCDFDRNYSVGLPSSAAAAGYAKLIDAAHAAFEIAKPGATAADLYHAMAKVVGDGDAGRLGHGLGLSLTEWPSLIPTDHTVLEEGMVLTLEPGVETARGVILVHEENIVIEAGGARMISTPAPTELPVI